MTQPSIQNARAPRLLLVDGHYYLYRSFFAIRGLTNSKGEPTNAIYGFVKALRRMLSDLKPDYAAVVWDAGLPERRTQLQPEYKQHRDEMPDDLEVQQEPIQTIVPLMGVASVFLENHEADDLIASYVTEARREGIECVVATNDKDILQMVGEGVAIYSTAKVDLGEGNGGYKLLGIPEVREKWGVDPALIADVLALTGDAADNIPGVPGVGGKTAAKWINQYGSLELVLSGEGVDAKVLEKIAPHRSQIESNRLMVALDLDLPLPHPITEMGVCPRYPELIEALRRCEFRSLTAELEREAAKLGASSLELEDRGMERVNGSKVNSGRVERRIPDLGGRREDEAEMGVGSRELEAREEISKTMGDADIPNSQLLTPSSQIPTQGELF